MVYMAVLVLENDYMWPDCPGTPGHFIDCAYLLGHVLANILIAPSSLGLDSLCEIEMKSLVVPGVL